MKKLLALLACAACGVALADGYNRVVADIPTGSNTTVTVKFAPRAFAVEPVAFDVSGSTVSSGTVKAFAIQPGDVTNVLFAAAAPAATNAFTVADFRDYLYSGEPITFEFSDAKGGKITVYGKAKQ